MSLPGRHIPITLWYLTFMCRLRFGMSGASVSLITDMLSSRKTTGPMCGDPRTWANSLRNWTVASMRRQVLNAARYSDSYAETGTPGSLPCTAHPKWWGVRVQCKHGAELGPRTCMHIECRVGPGCQFDTVKLPVLLNRLSSEQIERHSRVCSLRK
jgi:hypothetical protein